MLQGIPCAPRGKLLFTIIFTIASIAAIAQQVDFDSTFTDNKQSFNIRRYQLEDYKTALVIRKGKQTILSDTLHYTKEFRLLDVNGDGQTDLIVTFSSNTDIQSLYLFDAATNKFRKVTDFDKYPVAEKVNGAQGIYYSYRKAGCADNYWISDLFKIADFKTIHIAQIYGNGCGDPGDIKVYTVKQTEKILTETLPYKSAVDNKNGKWGFIAEYWKLNFQKFK